MVIPKKTKAAFLVLFCALYFYGLSSMGLVTPDEPRYADIGRAMARTGDWITPRLFGAPWYEKPALLYWMTAIGNLAGLGPELAPRLPIALLSVGFLVFFWWRVKIEWSAETAAFAAATLATSAGWLGYSHVGVTDVPVSVFFNAALLLALPWIETGDRKTLSYASACLGLAVLAKGLVPLVFFAPVAIFGWRRLLDWFRPAPIAIFCLIAVPWYALVSWRSGGEFLRVFFLEHHFGRFESAALQHVQPWWFYGPVILLLLLPWFPMAVTLFSSEVRTAKEFKTLKARLLMAVIVFGLVFFSLSVNKLPGYVLPLLPLFSILFAQGFVQVKHWRPPLVATATLVGLLPFTGRILPAALANGLRTASIPWSWTGFAVAGLILGLLSTRFSRAVAFATVAAVCGAAFFELEISAFPQIDRAASARPLWLEKHPDCMGKMTRSLAYGLEYYAEHALSDCDVLDQPKARVVR